MNKIVIALIIVFSLTATAKVNLEAIPEKIILEGQEIFISKAEIIVNKMPAIGNVKRKNYIIVTLKTGDGKKIKANYTITTLSFPGCKQNFRGEVKEARGDTCVVRDLPSWAGKGTVVALTLKDSKGIVHSLRTIASLMEVH